MHQEQHDPKAFRERMIKRMQWIIILLITFLVISILFVNKEPAQMEPERIFSRGGELKIEHDEMVMLLVSLVVVIEIFTSYKFIRFIPHRGILLSSFFIFVLSAISTVVEGFVFKDVLNYIEHFSLMVSAILLAVWCGRVFQAREREEP